MLKNAHLLHPPHPPSLRRTFEYAYFYFLRSQDLACLRVAASAEAGVPYIWAFLSILGRMTLPHPAHVIRKSKLIVERNPVKYFVTLRFRPQLWAATRHDDQRSAASPQCSHCYSR